MTIKPGSQYDAGASVKSAEHNQRRIVNKFYVGTLDALVRATAGDAGNRLDFYSSVGQRDVLLMTLAPASYCEPGFTLPVSSYVLQLLDHLPGSTA